MDAVTHLAPTIGVLAACDVLGVARASFYRQRPMFGPTDGRRPSRPCQRSGRRQFDPSAPSSAPAC